MLFMQAVDWLELSMAWSKQLEDLKKQFAEKKFDKTCSISHRMDL